MLQGQRAAVGESLGRMGIQVDSRAGGGSGIATLGRVRRGIWLEKDRKAII